MVVFQNILNAAAERYDERKEERKLYKEKIATGSLLQVDSPDRVTMRLDRLCRISSAASALRETKVAMNEGTFGAAAQMPDFRSIAEERLIGKSDLMSITYLEQGILASRAICRIEIKLPAGKSFGTGFMVSPNLLLTNNHVLPKPADATLAKAQFNYQTNLAGDLEQYYSYSLDPDTFFVTDRTLDFTLVAVKNSVDGKPELKSFGWHKMLEEQGKILIGEFASIIQHPDGQPKQLAFRENQIVDMMEQFLHYSTDTAPGSSGSPIFNDQWEIVGLHHSGVARRDGSGNILSKTGQIWRSSMGEQAIDWIANEGVRISRIVDFVKRHPGLSDAQRKLRAELFDTAVSRPVTGETSLQTQRSSPPIEPGYLIKDGFLTYTIPVQISLGIGGLQSAAAKVASPADNLVVRTRSLTGDFAQGEPAEDFSEGVSIDPDYENRTGYNSEFLGNGIVVPMPILAPFLKAKASVNSQPLEGEKSYVLPYEHFSVIMNKERRFAFVTASNIDGKLSYKSDPGLKRTNDKWFFDPRIPKNHQFGNDLYANNDLDRGHLVRRLDPAWGSDLDEAKKANDDTFHFTNCSPQHKDFNQNKTTWAGLEDYVLDNAIAFDKKVCVFTGPIFDEADPFYRTAQIPQQFWKVLAIIKSDKSLSATAYLLDQSRLVTDLTESAFTFGAYRTFQIPVEKIERLTGLKFGNLSQFDPLAGQDDLAEEAIVDTTVEILPDYSNIKL